MKQPKKSKANVQIQEKIIICENGHKEYFSGLEGIDAEVPEDWKCAICDGKFKKMEGFL